MFIENNIIKESRSCTLPGAGIDLDEYKMTPYPEESRNIRFLFIGRVMKEKGVEELFKAAKNIKKIYPEVSFDIVGPMEDDYKERIQSLVRNGSFIIMAIRKMSNHSLRNAIALYYHRIMKAWQIHC